MLLYKCRSSIPCSIRKIIASTLLRLASPTPALRRLRLLLDNMTILNHVKKTREQNNITQEELAAAVGVSRQTIIAIEKGNYEPSLGLAMKIAKFFKLK